MVYWISVRRMRRTRTQFCVVTEFLSFRMKLLLVTPSNNLSTTHSLLGVRHGYRNPDAAWGDEGVLVGASVYLNARIVVIGRECLQWGIVAVHTPQPVDEHTVDVCLLFVCGKVGSEWHGHYVTCTCLRARLTSSVG